MTGPARREVLLAGLACLVSSRPLRVRAQGTVTLSGSPTQGGLVLGRAPSGSRVWIDDREVRCTGGLFCFGFPREAEAASVIRVLYPDGHEETRAVTPERRDFPVQRVDGLPERYVSPPPEVQERIARDAKAVTEARLRDTGATAFTEPFDWPLAGIVTGAYGSQRVLNGQPREPHYGVDIAAPEGTPLRAPADGVVTLAEDLYLSGNTLVIDHGHGVSTSYLHMSRIDVKPGDSLRRGGALGLVGQTGRATGPHLCWRMNWFQTRLDVALAASSRVPIKA